MAIFICIIILLIVVAVNLLSRLLMLKSDLKHFKRRLDFIMQNDTNITVDIETRDKEIVHLAKSIDGCLKKVKSVEKKFAKKEKELTNTVTNISHDLRTPLTAIMGYLQLMSGAENLTLKQTEYLEILKKRTDFLKQLTEELFGFSLLSEEQLVLKQENINSILENSVLEFYSEFKLRNIEPVIKVCNAPIMRSVDKKALIRVFNNVISNALKYGDGDLRIELDDNGAITFENSSSNLDLLSVGKIFDRYFTVESDRNSSSSGLGLSIVKLLLEKMNGKISASMDGEYLRLKIELI